MAGFGRTIRIYLPDGVATGIKSAELVNWTGQALVCPRGRVGELSKWPQSQRLGVYILVGEDPEGSKRLAYIGESENVQNRLKAHIDEKDFWDHVVLFTSKDENLTKAHGQYLEARMHELTREADRFHLENSNSPKKASLPRSDRDAMEEFLHCARILLAALGFPLLQPVLDKSLTEEDSRGTLAGYDLSFEVPKHGLKAQGRSIDEGFVVLAGSLAAGMPSASLSGSLRKLRGHLIEDSSLEIESNGSRAVFLKDVLFKSPSAAASVVSGDSRNGRIAWKTATGKTLKELEDALLEDSDEHSDMGPVFS